MPIQMKVTATHDWDWTLGTIFPTHILLSYLCKKIQVGTEHFSGYVYRSENKKIVLKSAYKNVTH